MCSCFTTTIFAYYLFSEAINTMARVESDVENAKVTVEEVEAGYD